MELLATQRAAWRDLQLGYESLERIEARDVTCSGFAVRIEHNRGRIASTTAKVEKKSVDRRPCFLCHANLPVEQKGVFYRNDYLVLCNPMPVVSGHFTIAHRTHRPQTIIEEADAFLQIMADFGRQWSIMYNGPKCGASAPDHLHFQAVPSGVMPVERQMGDLAGSIPVARIGDTRILHGHGIGREVAVVEGSEPDAVRRAFLMTLDALGGTGGSDKEPMVNVFGSFNGVKWRVMIFPRSKHRPDAFFREGDDRIVVSPAVVEMAGILVTPVKKDFDRLEAHTVEEIYREVSLDASKMKDAMDALRGKEQSP